MIAAKVVADSKNNNGRITTMVITMPRYILAEFNTHRMFSRNSASSRAIPFEKMLKSIGENPFMPMAWMKDHKGMQGTEFFSEEESKPFIASWLKARDNAVTSAIQLGKSGVTKQLINRLLEPFMWHTVIVTATEYENFFALRCPKYKTEHDPDRFFRSKKDWLVYHENLTGVAHKLTDLEFLKLNGGQAEIHMMALAEAMWDALNESKSKKLNKGEWHIPFGDNIDEDSLQNIVHETEPAPTEENNYLDEWGNYHTDDLKIKIATARCARVSYTVVGEEGKTDNYENDIKLHDRLAASGHWSPFEHCALNIEQDKINGNFKGFVQYRKMFVGENILATA